MTAPPQPSWWYKTKTMAHSLWIMAYPSATDEYVEEVHEALMVSEGSNTNNGLPLAIRGTWMRCNEGGRWVSFC